MIEILAKQAIGIKCGFSNAKMTGNYECAYALGVVSGYAGIPMQDSFDNLISLKESVLSMLPEAEPDDEKMKQLIKILRDYEPQPLIDEQMIELYKEGYTEKKI
ncbi:MAG: DUF3837 domain-containing protein [Lachnospira sp.]